MEEKIMHLLKTGLERLQEDSEKMSVVDFATSLNQLTNVSLGLKKYKGLNDYLANLQLQENRNFVPVGKD